jgi:histidine ammonia-lyase
VKPAPLALTGHDLTPETVAQVARRDRAVALAPAALERMAAARAVVERHLEQDRPVYGLTTGLGARVTHRLPREVLSEFSRLTILGRSNAVGPRLPRDVVRALMLVRLNGLLAGGAGAAPAVAEAIAALLARGLTPVMPSIGSIGAGDLCVLAHLGLALIGEGEIEVEGRARPAAEALADAGLAPLTLGPKDGLGAAYETAQIAAALSMEGFRANLSPLDPRAAAARPAPGQAEAAAGLRRLLAGGALTEAGAARRLQDPISLRCVSQVHGSLKAALAFAGQALGPELNGAADNPLVLIEQPGSPRFP